MSNNITVRGDVSRFTIGSDTAKECPLDVLITNGDIKPLQGDIIYIDKINAYYFTNSGKEPVLVDGREVKYEEYAIIADPKDFTITAGETALHCSKVYEDSCYGINIKLEGKGEIFVDPSMSFECQLREAKEIQELFNEQEMDKLFVDDER